MRRVSNQMLASFKSLRVGDPFNCYSGRIIKCQPKQTHEHFNQACPGRTKGTYFNFLLGKACLVKYLPVGCDICIRCILNINDNVAVDINSLGEEVEINLFYDQTKLLTEFLDCRKLVFTIEQDFWRRF